MERGEQAKREALALCLSSCPSVLRCSSPVFALAFGAILASLFLELLSLNVDDDVDAHSFELKFEALQRISKHDDGGISGFRDDTLSNPAKY